MSVQKAVLLLGRRDEPTDGVADYSEKLREAGAGCGIAFEIARVPWAENGWRDALSELRRAAGAWRDHWVFLQYTTLAWSMRGFSWRAPGVLKLLRRCGARPAVVFHDFMPARGSGIVARARAWTQQRVLRRLYARSDLAIFTVPVEKIPWVPALRDKAVFIPVGSNFPELDLHRDWSQSSPASGATVAIFGITDGATGDEEIRDIAYALKCVQTKGVRVRLLALGRGTAAFEDHFRQALNGSGIELSVLGLIPGGKLVQVLAGAQAMLCVRGHVSSRRGSAIAGISCGLPIVGYRGPETGFPISEAGVVLVDRGDREALGRGLARVLTDEIFHQELRQRSTAASQKYFCWKAIASQFGSAMS
jgi:glycosyltransferase involved in cell wall biosynthesis